MNNTNYIPAVKKNPQLPLIDELEWNKNEREDLQYYIDWHRRHPHCRTPPKVNNIYDSDYESEEEDDRHERNNASKLKRQIKTPQCGQNGNFIEVSKNFNSYSNEMRMKQNSIHADPWWKMSVREQKIKYHVSNIPSTIHETNLKLLEKNTPDSDLSVGKKLSAKSEIYIGNNNDKSSGNTAPVNISQKNNGSNNNFQTSKFTEDGQEALEGYSHVFNELKVNYALQLYHDEIYQKEEKRRYLQEKRLHRSQLHSNVNYESTSATRATTFLKTNDNIYNEMTSRLGGTLALEDMSKEWLKLAQNSKKQSGDKTSFLTGDTKLTFIDACDRGHVPIIQKLLEFGMSPNMIANEEPIFIVVCRKIIAIDDINGKGMAVSGRNTSTIKKPNLYKILKLLLEFGAKINARLRSGNTALHLAAQSGNLQLVLFLLDQEAYIDVRVLGNHVTPLMEAAKMGYVELMAALLRRGADMMAVDIDKRTALHYAAIFGKTAAAAFLVRAGAILNVLDKDGKSPVIVAEENDHFTTAQMMGSVAPYIPLIQPRIDFILEKREKELKELNDMTKLAFGKGESSSTTTTPLTKVTTAAPSRGRQKMNELMKLLHDTPPNMRIARPKGKPTGWRGLVVDIQKYSHETLEKLNPLKQRRKNAVRFL